MEWIVFSIPLNSEPFFRSDRTFFRWTLIIYRSAFNLLLLIFIDVFCVLFFCRWFVLLPLFFNRVYSRSWLTAIWFLVRLLSFVAVEFGQTRHHVVLLVNAATGFWFWSWLDSRNVWLYSWALACWAHALYIYLSLMMRNLYSTANLLLTLLPLQLNNTASILGTEHVVWCHRCRLNIHRYFRDTQRIAINHLIVLDFSWRYKTLLILTLFTY